MDAEESIKYPAGPIGEPRNQCGPPITPFAAIGLAEIRKSFEPVAEQYPPILNLEQAAELAGIAASTLRRHVSEGLYEDAVSRRKPLRFWRDRFAQAVMKDKPRLANKPVEKSDATQ